MKNVSTISANAIVISSIIALLILQSCDVGEPFKAASTVQTPEINTPTGCLKSKGRYYDPKIKECVQVTDQQQALELDAYREVNQIAEEGKISEGEYSIGFSSFMTLDKTESLWSELSNKGAKMYGVFGRLPESIPGACGWHHDFNAAPEENTIKSMLQKGIDSMAANPAWSDNVAATRKAIFDDNLCRIESMWVVVNPKVIKDFWDQHLIDIQGIRPQITNLDKTMPTFGPLQPFAGDK